ncbi:translation initiation factor eIF-2B subunit delta, putative [Plasmodium chabaudi adami]|uniref:Translation initiation factor eIF2B subunit delta n=1 Tax=Plasmodium chabaudi adami TaxID=5826 RepID=A0A1C6YI48_PLACE|nr:translation initiation factor eIF-2B subunit delta, putative [Plasmodium chabaudi adami]
MDDKFYLTFSKRKKKKVSGTINKEKFKKNFSKSEKYVKVSILNKNPTKKTLLHTLFKGFVKPCNEKSTIFYSILCIINNIYKCPYFTKHRCLICKPLYYNRLLKLKQEYEDNDKSDDIDDEPSAPLKHNLYYNRRKVDKSGVAKEDKKNDINDISNPSTSNNKFEHINKSNEAISNNCMGKDHSYTCKDKESVKFDTEEKEQGKGVSVQNAKEENEDERDDDDSKIKKNKIKREEIKHDKNEKGENCEESKNTITYDPLKTNTINNKTKLNLNSNKQNNPSNKTSLFSTCPFPNILSGKLNLSSIQQYNFLLHDNKINYLDLYNFDVFDKTTIYDKILLDLNQNEIHTNILRTGIHFNKYMNTTHNHRNVDLLMALKSFIKDYTLPPYEPINRHMKIVIDKEINYIIMCKKHSISMGEVIRWFKNMVTESIGKHVLEEIKEIIINNINNYIRTKIIIPSINISNYVSEYIIEDGDVLLIYTFDYDIYISMINAKKKGKTFEIFLVDSEPYKNSHNIKLYIKLGIPVTYTLLSSLSYNIKKCTKVLLGIDSIMHNNIYGYAGTSMICMISKVNNVPVYIVCETYKISNKIVIDSFSMNNINNNIDVYDYIYLHHYHNSKHHHNNIPSIRKNDKIVVDSSLEFNKKLNNFIESYPDIKSNQILFSNINDKSYIETTNCLKQNINCPKPPIIYSSGTPNKFYKKRRKENEKKHNINNICDKNESPKYNDASIKCEHVSNSFEKSNIQSFNDNQSSSLYIENKNDQTSSNVLKKNIFALHEEEKTSLFIKVVKDEKTNTLIMNKNSYEEININKMNKDQISIGENNANQTSSSTSGLKKKETPFFRNTVKDISNERIVSTKSIMKIVDESNDNKKVETINICINHKHNITNVSNDCKNVNKKNKQFYNMKNDKTFYEQKNSYFINFKNYLDMPSSNSNPKIKHNGIEEERTPCNNVCDSICKSIGNLNIKNICIDRHNETNLFSSVLSHIDKIKTNADKSFYVANICNDVTPLNYISYIVTEVGVYTSENKNSLNVFIQNNI